MKTLKLRIYPNKIQTELILKHIGCVRFIYNWALSQKIKHYQEHNKSLHKYTLCKELPKLKEEFPWLKEVNAQSLENSIFKLEEAYNAFFRKHSKFPKFQSKKCGSQSFVARQKVKLNLDRRTIRLPKIGWIRFRTHSNIISQIGKIITTYIKKTSTNKFYTCIVYEDLPVPKVTLDESKSVGIDLGLTTFATISDGTKIEHPNTLKKYLPKLKEVDEKYSKDKSERNRLIRAKLYEKIANCRMDFLQKLTTSIAENQDYHVVCIEDLSIQDMFGDISNINRKIADSCWRKFRELLKYKLESRGKKLIIIGRFDPSSKTCTCGTVNHDLTLDQREWICSICGVSHDRDLLAAQNIKRWGTPLNELTSVS